jgi:hypothetical protein
LRGKTHTRMRKELTEIERLDLAAKARVAELSLPQKRFLLVILSVSLVVLAATSTASSFETLVMRIMAVLSTAATITLFSRWRYALHLSAAVWFIIAVGLISVRLHDPTAFSGWAFGYIAFIVLFGCRFWKEAGPYAAVQAWNNEQSQVQQWLKMLMNPAADREVIEVSSGSFWTGYYVHRMLRSGNYWAIASWPKNFRRPREYRVFGSDSIRITELPDGALDILMGTRRLGRVKVARKIYDSLLNLAKS